VEVQVPSMVFPRIMDDLLGAFGRTDFEERGKGIVVSALWLPRRCKPTLHLWF